MLLLITHIHKKSEYFWKNDYISRCRYQNEMRYNSLYSVIITLWEDLVFIIVTLLYLIFLIIHFLNVSFSLIHPVGYTTPTPQSHPENSLRLVGGPSPLYGRLEIFHNAQWGTVCDDAFSLQDAHVACRQLGFSDGIEVITSDIYGIGEGVRNAFVKQQLHVSDDGYELLPVNLSKCTSICNNILIIKKTV